jgi:putative glutamine amidotransferase
LKHARVIGITQRMTVNPPHNELRDCLATDWYPFLRALDMPWIVLPNDAQSALYLAEYFALGGLILSGGDDIGVFPRRDETEFALLAWATREAIPVVGVCRGFQVISTQSGGQLAEVDSAVHRGKRHTIRFADGTRREVNSYHTLAPSALPPSLVPLAHCTVDGCPEAASGKNLLGILWHPEREPEPDPEDVLMITTYLSGSQ